MITAILLLLSASVASTTWIAESATPEVMFTVVGKTTRTLGYTHLHGHINITATMQHNEVAIAQLRNISRDMHTPTSWQAKAVLHKIDTANKLQERLMDRRSLGATTHNGRNKRGILGMFASTFLGILTNHQIADLKQRTAEVERRSDILRYN